MNTLNLKDVSGRITQIPECLLEKKNPLNKLGLICFIISESLLPNILSVKSQNSYRSDHSPVILPC